jgi:hypothetical protein
MNAGMNVIIKIFAVGLQKARENRQFFQVGMIVA